MTKQTQQSDDDKTPPVAPSPSTSSEQLDVAVADKQPRVGPAKLPVTGLTPLDEQRVEKVGPVKLLVARSTDDES